MAIRSNLSRQRGLFLVAVVALYAGLLVAKQFLRGPALWDEADFWTASLSFSTRFIPTIEQLTSYKELNTPLPFILFGWLERLFQQDMFAGRLLCMLLSIVIVFAVGWPTARKGWRSHRCLTGLLLCPYFLLYSGLLYTDIIACFFVLMGVMGYVHNRHLISCIAFVLAIASRQYMLAFPAAIALYEFVTAMGNISWRSLKVNRQLRWKDQWRWMAPAIATGSILGWIILFQGLAPKPAFMTPDVSGAYSAVLAVASGDASPAVLVTNVPPVQQSLWALTPGAAVNFLSCVALYMVIPEAVLFMSRHPLRQVKSYLDRIGMKLWAIAALLLIFATIFPPLHSELGILIKLTNQISNEELKFVFFYGLALISCLRFAKFDVISLSVWLNCLIMMKAYPWDKYVLPLVVVFWYLKSRDLSVSRFVRSSSTAAKISV
ncbi:MAG: hypothetical protein DCF25_21220 [Leptolyngbya foveolarum]|uniref:Glycosyltransferase RgtA/B/C/D-like domain-containing protein n=1 Tax=Leptolyngbya foveolarum TaxID=47253 RepID=A0A2W4VSM8_9CYAN|nr:MAG: hypothetical protein DCF25_21220 [Leptolyngbya foveolarum]